MSEPSPNDPAGTGASNPPRSLTPAERVAHYKNGYDNSQAVVRFLDTKATAAIAAIPLVIAALTGLFGLVKDWARWEKAFASHHVCLLWVFVALCLIAAITAIVFAVRVVWFAFGAISPRDVETAKPSVLFPRAADGFPARVELFKQDAATALNVYEDYEQQILQMSTIVDAKLIGVKNAIGQLRMFFGASLILLISFLITAGVAALLASLTP